MKLEGTRLMLSGGPWAPALGVNPRLLPLAHAALAQDPAAEVPRDSSIASVLLSVMWRHPEAQQLVVMVYSLLAIVCSQGGSACPPQPRLGARGWARSRLHCSAFGWPAPPARPFLVSSTNEHRPWLGLHAEACFTLAPSLPLCPAHLRSTEHLGS